MGNIKLIVNNSAYSFVGTYFLNNKSNNNYTGWLK